MGTNSCPPDQWRATLGRIWGEPRSDRLCKRASSPCRHGVEASHQHERIRASNPGQLPSSRPPDPSEERLREQEEAGVRMPPISRTELALRILVAAAMCGATG